MHRQLDGSAMDMVPHPFGPEDSYDLGKAHFVRSFPTVHPVPSQGYVVYGRKSKLRQEYQGLPGSQIRDLRREPTHLLAARVYF